MSVSAMKQALEALEFFCEYGAIDRPFERIAELKQAIAEAEKPWVKTYAGGKPNYTTPVHASDIPQERVDETAKDRHKFEEMVKKGTKAWDGTPDDWVDDLRGGADKQEPDDIYDVWKEKNNG